MSNYMVTFFKKTEDGYQSIGTMSVDDSCTNLTFTLQAKIFRMATPHMQTADKIQIQRVSK